MYAYGVRAGVVEFSRRAGVITFLGQREIRLGPLRLQNFERTAEVTVDVRGVKMLRASDLELYDVVGTWYEPEDRLLRELPVVANPTTTTLTIIWHTGPDTNIGGGERASTLSLASSPPTSGTATAGRTGRRKRGNR